MHRDANGNNRVQCKRYLFLEKAARQQERKYKSKESEQRTSIHVHELEGRSPEGMLRHVYRGSSSVKGLRHGGI